MPLTTKLLISPSSSRKNLEFGHAYFLHLGNSAYGNVNVQILKGWIPSVPESEAYCLRKSGHQIRTCDSSIDSSHPTNKWGFVGLCAVWAPRREMGGHGLLHAGRLHAGTFACRDICMPGHLHAGTFACRDICMPGHLHAGRLHGNAACKCPGMQMSGMQMSRHANVRHANVPACKCPACKCPGMQMSRHANVTYRKWDPAKRDTHLFVGSLWTGSFSNDSKRPMPNYTDQITHFTLTWRRPRPVTSVLIISYN
ncbi:hypothetical protein Ddc_10824 [Ditylenchus destructor]|nr:hypothetical protein Ddc_10824 [Ditylenchus destructor]